MSKTISASYTHAINLTLSSENPVTLTSTAKLTPNSGADALYGEAGIGWTITNAGSIDGGTIAVGIRLGASSNYVGASVITNQTGGTIEGQYGIRVYDDAASSVTNQVGANITAIQSTLSSDSAVYMYATDTVTNFGTITAPTSSSNSRGVLLVNGGAVINNSTGTITGGTGIFVEGIGTVTNAGTIKAGSPTGIAVDFTNSGNNLLIVDPAAGFYGGVVGGSGTLELASVSNEGSVVAGSLTATNFTGFNAIDFDNQSQWTLAGSSSALTGVIRGFTSHDTIDLVGFFATAASYAGGNLTLTNAANAHTTLHFSGGPFNTGTPHVTTSGTGTVLTDLCFCAGTRIATPSGEVPVQRLAIGDMVLTQRGEARLITWIGQGKVLAAPGRRNAATPVIVCKGALGDKVPRRDLRLTKGHSLHLDDVLIPVEFLVNHRSIIWDDRAQEVEVYHIELATHDVLLANGAPAESYRDDGNRWLFRNANSAWHLPSQEPCAPVLTGGPVVDAIWRRLLDRAGPRPYLPLTEDADLHLLVDGQRLDAASHHDEVHVFRLAAPPQTVRIASRAAAPQELGVARDPRVLGVALRRIMLRRGARMRLIEAADASLAEGFHGYEPDNLFRWTDGDAVLPAALFDGVQGRFELELHIACRARYIDDAAAVAVA